MPTARKTKSGNWRCQAFDYVEIIDGKKKYHHRSFTARTKYEAERMANEFLRNDENTAKLNAHFESLHS